MEVKILVLILLNLKWKCVSGFRSTLFPIGGLFNGKTQTNSRVAFEKIVEHKSAYHGRLLLSNVIDSYSTALEVCPFTSDNQGVVALIDARPTNGICDTICLLCNRLNITHLSTSWQIPDTSADDLYTFYYYPPSELISKAFSALIRTLHWDKFTILYEDDGSFIRLKEIANLWPYDQEPILYRKLDPDGDNRETFKYVFKVARMSYHILDCEVRNVPKYIEEILQVENSTQYQSFIFTNLDAYTLSLENFPDFMANVSTLHLTTANDIRWKDIDMDTSNSFIRLETALVADALNHLETSIRSMQGTFDEESGGYMQLNPKYDDPPAICFSENKAMYESLAWSSGDDLRKALRSTKTKGFTGDIEFDDEGKRTNFPLHYSKLNNESHFVHAGRWHSKSDIIETEKVIDERSTGSRSKVIKIVSRKGLPYFDIVEINGTTTFRGYAVDLVEAIAQHVRKELHTDFNYEFYRVSEDKYGERIEGTKKWDGIIGELMDHTADLAVCDITITSERNSAVDFSVPFMSLGISTLMKESDPVEPDKFSFMKPLALDVWLYLCTAYIIVSFFLLICARMSQGDWVNPHACNQNPENLQNIWSLYNCMWLTMGAIMTQGCDILPRAAGSRWISGMWWFFALILTSSYTANMSTFLSNSRRSNDIADVKALSEQNKVTYGAVYNSSTYKFFENSNESMYQKMWTVMNSARPTVFTHSNEEGKERVVHSKGNYAFFLESTALEYYLKRNCELKMVGSELDSKEYGIAMPKNSPHKGYVDNAILALSESGDLGVLKKKWWEEEDNAVKCDNNENEEDNSGSLQMKNTSGIFLVLAFGAFMGILVAIIDFLVHSQKIAVKEKVTFYEAMASEWRASLNPRALHKPAAPPRSAAPSSGSPSPRRERSQSRAVSVLKAASSFINFDEIY